MSYAMLSRKSATTPAATTTAKAASSNLRIGEPGDSFEQEADRVADQVIAGGTKLGWSLSRMSMRTPLQRKCSCGGSAGSMGECEECKKKETLQRRAARPATPSAVPSIVHEVLGSPGHTLDHSTRAFFESRFGYDFGHVRIHTDTRAAESASAVNALAYTLGNHIVFSSGHYAPQRSEGRSLLAHELAHVVQQSSASQSREATLLPSGSSAEQEAKIAGSALAEGRTPQISQRVSRAQLSRQEKPGGSTPPPTGSGAPAGASAGPSGGTPPAKTQRLRFDILGADTEVANFLAKAAGLSRDPDLRVTSLEDMITQLENKAPAGSPACVEHISIFNHGMPGYQAVTGEGDKKISAGAGALPGKLPRSGFTLDWLYQPANQARLARLRNVFCCGAEMNWLGCGTAGIIAQGGTRSAQEVKEHPERYGPKFGDRYRDEQDAIAHGANLAGAKFGKITVQSWADATCTSIRAATDFTLWDLKNPASVARVGLGGEFLDIKPSAAGQCACDSASGRVHGTWDPSKGIEYGDNKWKTDLNSFNQAVKPASGPPNPTQITATLVALVRDVVPTLTIPPGLPLATPAVPWVNSTTIGVEGYAFEHMPFCFPADAWKWIAVTPGMIQQTPAYTRTALDHELRHAADMLEAANKFKATHGPPPAAPSGACTPGFQATNSTPFGKYVVDFHDFYSKGLPRDRHLQIYSGSATPNFQKFTPEEKLFWFASMLTAVPSNVSPKDSLPTEPLVNSVFENPLAYEERMRRRFNEQLIETATQFIDGSGKTHEKDLGKAMTLLNHFNSAWKFNMAARALLFEMVKNESKTK